MKVISVDSLFGEHVKIQKKNGQEDDYIRYGPDSWQRAYGESLEWEYDPVEEEKAYQEFIEENRVKQSTPRDIAYEVILMASGQTTPHLDGPPYCTTEALLKEIEKLIEGMVGHREKG